MKVFYGKGVEEECAVIMSERPRMGLRRPQINAFWRIVNRGFIEHCGWGEYRLTEAGKKLRRTLELITRKEEKA